MKKSDFAGWREVFSFTFSQKVKQKAYIIFIVIFSVIALFQSTVITLFKQYSEQKEKKSNITEIVIFDETGLGIAYENVLTGKELKNVPVIDNPSKTMDEYEKEMEETDEGRMLINVTYDEENEQFHVTFIQGKNKGLSELSKFDFSNEFCDFFEDAKMNAVNITKQQMDYINADITKEIKYLSKTGAIMEDKKDSISLNDYSVMLALLMVCMLMINICGNQIATSIATEKSSRVIEYLVLNVRPLALITGKLLGAIVTASLQMVAVGFCYMSSPIISNLITPSLAKWLFGIEKTAEAGKEIAQETLAYSVKMIHGIKMEYAFFALVFVILGIVLYGILAGLLGASVSKMDEMQDAMSLFQMLLIIGCYADLALCIMQMSGKGIPVLSKILSICPVTSPFLVPGSMLLGKMSWPLIIASIIVMLISIAFLFNLTAKVYEALIFYNGKALKFKDILAMASSIKESAHKEEENNEE